MEYDPTVCRAGRVEAFEHLQQFLVVERIAPTSLQAEQLEIVAAIFGFRSGQFRVDLAIDVGVVTISPPVLRAKIWIAGRPHHRGVGQADLSAAAFRAFQSRGQVVMHGRRIGSETRGEVLEVEPMAVVES